MGNRKLAKKKKEQAVFVAPKIDNATITTENITVKNLSEKIGRPVTEIIKQLMILGVMANINSTIDYMTAELVCGELGVKLEQKLEKSYEEQMLEDVKIQDNEEINVVSSFEIYSPYYDGKKTWMDYRAVTDRKSVQYSLLRDYSYTGDYGIRMVDDRFCVAVGSRFSLEIGQYFDLVLENGFTIPCIKGDAKSNDNTDSTNTFTITNNSYCCSEFIVDQTVFRELFPGVGNLSKIDENWNSKVIEIIVYDYNIFNAAREL